jgi:hypothetical protein
MTASLWVRQLHPLGMEEMAFSSIDKELFFSTYLNKHRPTLYSKSTTTCAG